MCIVIKLFKIKKLFAILLNLTYNYLNKLDKEATYEYYIQTRLCNTNRK